MDPIARAPAAPSPSPPAAAFQPRRPGPHSTEDKARVSQNDHPCRQSARCSVPPSVLTGITITG